MSQGRKLVIVESPAKARTIAGFLPGEYEVEASVGHIRDLPQPSELPAEMKKGPYKKFAVDIDNNFTPYYVVDSDKKKKVAELKKALKDADELLLATDEDREGEAIAWHLLEVLKPKVPVKRMVFHEITEEAIQAALDNPREIDTSLVDAQETRRILDRLYGYEVSPVLWRKVGKGLSAGRVQSVATRLVVERERERMAFVPAHYWDLLGEFGVAANAQGDAENSERFNAKLLSLGDRRIATGKDFTDAGQLRDAAVKKGVVVLDSAEADALVEQLKQAAFSVEALETKPYRRRPAAPFTTSTLQQEASRKLRLSSRQTMRIAQSLYENGYITYMRTDSTVLSTQAIAAARAQAKELYGANAVPEKPRYYATKSQGAQEAHEAIRPAGSDFRTPSELAGQLDQSQLRVYDLIWKRTVASQMADATGSTATVRLGADSDSGHAVFTASGTVITFRGFLAAYEEGRDAERYKDKTDQERLPQLSEGQQLSVTDMEASGHETSAPPRYTEASLIKALEERGIGRPSTYAATISVISDRGYVHNRGQALVPSWVAFSVVRLMENHFQWLIDYDFTAQMEQDLDKIAAGDLDRGLWLHRFYFGDQQSQNEADYAQGLAELVNNLGDIDAKEINSIPVADDIMLRVGRYGPYVEREVDGELQRASVSTELAPDELTAEKAEELLTQEAQNEDRVLGTNPETGRQIVAKNGRFGPYITEELLEEESNKKVKPRTASLFKSMDLETIDLEQALKLFSLPREVGVDPETDQAITAQNGRYGPYLKKGTDSRTLSSEEELFTITLEQALEIYKQPKRGRGGAAAKPPLKELGVDPTSEGTIVVKDGRFGPYVTDGKTNATLRKDDSVEAVTLERAIELLAEKRAKPPTKRTRKAPAKKSTAKKAPAKKTTAKKTTTKKTAAKKTGDG